MVITIKSYLYALRVCSFCLITDSVIQQRAKVRKIFSHIRLICQPTCIFLTHLQALGISKLLVCCRSWSTSLLPNCHLTACYSKQQRVIAIRSTELFILWISDCIFILAEHTFLLYTKQKTLEAYTLECITNLKLTSVVKNFKIFATVTQLAIF